MRPNMTWNSLSTPHSPPQPQPPLLSVLISQIKKKLLRSKSFPKEMTRNKARFLLCVPRNFAIQLLLFQFQA